MILSFCGPFIWILEDRLQKILHLRKTCVLKLKINGEQVTYLETSVVEGREDSDSRVDVLQFSQESSVKVRVHVAVDPEKLLEC